MNITFSRGDHISKWNRELNIHFTNKIGFLINVELRYNGIGIYPFIGQYTSGIIFNILVPIEIAIYY